MRGTYGSRGIPANMLHVEKIMARACMKWSLCRSNLHPSMSHNLDGAMNAACHVKHEFALQALGFMHVMHVMHAIFVGHVYACHGCMSWMLAICMRIAMHALCAAHACVFIMHALCAVDHACIPQHAALCQHTRCHACLCFHMLGS